MANKTKQAKASRIDIVDFWRFFAAIMIILCHVNVFGGREFYLYLFVDFFFMLTGYFIFKHFQKPQFVNQDTDKKAKDALKYTWNRFLKLLPYTIPIVIICFIAVHGSYCLHHHTFQDILYYIENIAAEALLLPNYIMPIGRVIGPIWYLSVMIFAMPVVCYIAQTKRLNILAVLAIPLFWFFLNDLYTFTAGNTNASLQLLRAFISMILGGLIFYITTLVNDAKKTTAKTRVVITITEILCYIIALIIGSFNTQPVNMVLVLLFVGLCATLSGLSYTANIKCRFFTFLGAISLPLFMWHYGIIRTIKNIDSFDLVTKYIVVFTSSILVSAAHYFIVKRITDTIAKRKTN